jgi:hypothetical protein
LKEKFNMFVVKKISQLIKISVLNIFLSIIVTTSLLLPKITKATELRYCVPVNKFDLNPFRPLNDGKELAYLLLLTPYISTTSGQIGLLSAYEFSPDGKIFTGRVNSDIKWPDGSSLSPYEAAYGITKGFEYRPIGKRVKALKLTSKKMNLLNGIRIIDSQTFEIKFESTTENLTGIVREALGSDSRHNRVWPIKVSDKSKTIEAIFNYPSYHNSKNILLDLGASKILFVDKFHCRSAEFTLYPEALGVDTSTYERSSSRSPQEISVMVNTSTLSLERRRALIGWIREGFSALPPESGIIVTPSFFSVGEPGYAPNIVWPRDSDLRLLRGIHLKIAVEIPIFRKVLESASRRDGIQVDIVELSTNPQKLDAELLSSGIHEGRHIILQDILKWGHVGEMMAGAPLTRHSLDLISERSASTIPTDSETLQMFEVNAMKEQSLANVGHRFLIAFTRRDSPISLIWTDAGQLIFRKRKL